MMNDIQTAKRPRALRASNRVSNLGLACLATALTAACSSAPTGSTEATSTSTAPITASATGGSTPVNGTLLPQGVDLGTGIAGCTRTQIGGGASSFRSTLLGSDKVAVYPSGGQGQPTDSANNAGGGAISNPVVELIFWGSSWNSSVPSRQDVTSAFNTFMGTSYFDGLAQYGVSHVSFDKTVSSTDFGVSDPPSSYQWSDVGFMVSLLVAKGAYGPFPNQSNVYIVMMPPGTTPSTACGSHSTYYAPYSGFLNVGWSSYGDLDSMTENASHELAEQMTDPDGGGWLMNRSFGSGWSEIGDACNGVADYMDTVLVQSYWSDADHACVLPFAPPVVTGMSPTSGQAGTVVNFTGRHLGGGLPSARFGGVTARSLGAGCSPTECSFVAPSGDLSMAVEAQLISNYQTTCLEGMYGQCVDFNYPCNGALVNGACLQCCATSPGSYDCLPMTTAPGGVTEVWIGSSSCTGGEQPTVVSRGPQQCGPVGAPPSCEEACTQTVYIECECPNGGSLINGVCESVVPIAGGGGTLPPKQGPGPVGPVRYQ